MAIAQVEIKAFNLLTGEELVDGRMNQLFSDKQTGTGFDVAWVVIQNTNATLNWSVAKFWFDYDLGGAALTAAIADGGTARAGTYGYPGLAVPTSWSSPVDVPTGIALPTPLLPTYKCVVAIKRDTTSAASASPERNRFWVVGSSPA